MMPGHIDARIATRANIYFDGKCISHSLQLPDGSRKSVGVILPSTLTFSTTVPEKMEIIEGECLVKLPGQTAAIALRGGQSFDVPANSQFEIEVVRAVHYVCHYG